MTASLFLSLGVTVALSVGGSMLALAVSYGGIRARLASLEKHADNTVTKDELASLSKRLDDVVAEIRGLRSDLVSVIRDHR